MPRTLAFLAVFIGLHVLLVAGRRPSSAAGSNEGHDDWRAELRRIPHPHVDPVTGTKTFRKHFERRDPRTQEVTFLSYNSSIPRGLYVDLNDNKYAVESACFLPLQSKHSGRVGRLVLNISHGAVQNLVQDLEETTIHDSHAAERKSRRRDTLHREDQPEWSNEGLLRLGPSRYPCRGINNPNIVAGDTDFLFNFTTANISSDDHSITLLVGQAAPEKFLGDTVLTFWTNATAARGSYETRESGAQTIPTNLNMNYDSDTGKRKIPLTLDTSDWPVSIGKLECKDCYFATNGFIGLDLETKGVQGVIFSYLYFKGVNCPDESLFLSNENDC